MLTTVIGRVASFALVLGVVPTGRSLNEQL